MDMLEAGKGLGKRSGDIERKVELLVFPFFGGHRLKQYAYFVSIGHAQSTPMRLLSARHNDDGTMKAKLT